MLMSIVDSAVKLSPWIQVASDLTLMKAMSKDHKTMGGQAVLLCFNL